VGGAETSSLYASPVSFPFLVFVEVALARLCDRSRGRIGKTARRAVFAQRLAFCSLGIPRSPGLSCLNPNVSRYSRSSARFKCARSRGRSETNTRKPGLRFEELETAPHRYRQLFWETGMNREVLYLKGEAAGVRATGIGFFFDDPVHELMGLRRNMFRADLGLKISKRLAYFCGSETGNVEL
jgi:hypothetical protein